MAIDESIHSPVLLSEVIRLLDPAPGGRYIDATINGGGHAEAILERSAPDGQLLGIDADPDGIRRASLRLARFGSRVHLRHGDHADIARIAEEAGFQEVNGSIFDLGLSSDQLANAARGFSFSAEGPLDMRFDPTQGTSAHEIVNTWPTDRLADAIYEFGEERHSRGIAKAIVAARKVAAINTTSQLASVVAEATPTGRYRIHPATRTFQALRIAVNRELEQLPKALEASVSLLTPGGVVAVISFHSLEDRIVKQFFVRESSDCLCPRGLPACACGHRARLRLLTRKPVVPSTSEVSANPRSRSARLRAAMRLNLQ